MLNGERTWNNVNDSGHSGFPAKAGMADVKGSNCVTPIALRKLSNRKA